MVELRYIGTHQPKGMIVDVEKEKVKELLDSEDYEVLGTKKLVVEPKEVKSDDNSKRLKG